MLAPRRALTFALVKKYSAPAAPLTFKSQSIFCYLTRCGIFLKRASLLAQICFCVGFTWSVQRASPGTLRSVTNDSQTPEPAQQTELNLCATSDHWLWPWFLELLWEGLNKQHSKKHLAQPVAPCRLPWVKEAAAPMFSKIRLLYLSAFFNLQNYFCALSHQQYSEEAR